MTQEELRHEYERLTHLNKMEDAHDTFGIFMNYFFKVIMNHHKQAKSYADSEAEILNQMMFSKIAHLEQMLGGIEYVADDGARLNRIIDPTMVANQVRNLYETVAMFNLVYINTESYEEKVILYNLWVLSGLNFRQRFESIIKQDESGKKLESEKKEIETLTNEIENTGLYKTLEEKDQKKIQTMIKKKDYKIQFSEGKVEFLTWADMPKIMRVQNGILDNIYTHLSFYSHPSNVSVFQFANMFNKGEEAFIGLAKFKLKYASFLIGIFVADYIRLFPEVINTFNALSQIDQIVINSFNTLARGYEFSINEEYKALG